jgi:hypothetical protein|tara:strand:- start:20781 stop:21062 length:282 start_codon:yes stop_codon:yes gene_type:complete
MRAIGVRGELRVGYQQAARLGEWRLETTRPPPGMSFDVEAAIRSTNSFWITQTPMTLDLQFGRFHWIWDDVRPALVNGSAAVRVFGKPRISKE